MIRLVCKGNVSAALDAAMLRGIPFSFERYTDEGRQTVGNCPDGYLSSVLSWYCEPSKPTEGVGYPKGTLLWYHSPGWIHPDEPMYPSTVRTDTESEAS
jgi:hypothetical protein